MRKLCKYNLLAIFFLPYEANRRRNCSFSRHLLTGFHGVVVETAAILCCSFLLLSFHLTLEGTIKTCVKMSNLMHNCVIEMEIADINLSLWGSLSFIRTYTHTFTLRAQWAFFYENVSLFRWHSPNAFAAICIGKIVKARYRREIFEIILRWFRDIW